MYKATACLLFTFGIVGRLNCKIPEFPARRDWKNLPRMMTFEPLTTLYVPETIALTSWANAWFTDVMLLILIGVIFYQIYLAQKKGKKFQQQLAVEREAKERLQARYESKTRMLTNITHEFRTPLTVILGLIDELEQSPAQQRMKRIGMIRRNGQHLLQFVNQLMELARLNARKATLRLVRDDVIGFLRLLVDSFHSLALSQRIGLQFYTEEPSLEMDFDPNRLQRILTNLLSNALKFTPEFGKILVVVKTATEEGQSYLCVKVQDSGRGIQPEKLPYIFDRFYQADAAPCVAGEGSGIGLAIVKELIHLMQGEIEVKSEAGKGTTVLLSLPVLQVAETPEDPALLAAHMPPIAGKPESVVKEGNSPKPYSAGTPLALVIEDNPDVAYFLRSCLGENWQTHAAPDGLAGLKKAFDLVPDVIICDVMLPGLDGFDVVAQLKADERTSHIPVLLLTSRATQTDKLTGLSNGADAYLIKPLDKKELLLRLENFMNLRRCQQEYFSFIQSEEETLAPEQRFLKKVNGAIHKHLDDPDFNSTLLAREVGVGRPQLHRKLKALTGCSTSLYMRSYRLKRARQLLLSTNLRVSEVVWKTGFKSFSWFNQAYKKEFGENPTDTRK